MDGGRSVLAHGRARGQALEKEGSGDGNGDITSGEEDEDEQVTLVPYYFRHPTPETGRRERAPRGCVWIKS